MVSGITVKNTPRYQYEVYGKVLLGVRNVYTMMRFNNYTVLRPRATRFVSNNTAQCGDERLSTL